MTDPDLDVGQEIEVYQSPAPPSSLFGTSDPSEVIERAAQAAEALKDVIDKKGLFSTISGKKHVRVEGWQLLGSMLGVTAVCVSTERLEDGWKATVEARRLDGTVVGRADALCSRAENQWKKRDEYALISMAQTRATSKALRGPLGFVVSLAGYSATPLEEIPGGVTLTEVAPAAEIAWGEDEQVTGALKQAFKALGYTKGKVRLVMSGCHDQQDREDLLAELEHEIEGKAA